MAGASGVSLFCLLVSLQIFAIIAKASASDHRYNVGDRVPLLVNKVGPLNNPSETYRYYDLPFCHPDQIVEKKESLGEVLSGDRLSSSLYELNFRKDKNSESICKKKLSKQEVATFREAVKRDYYYQLYYDDLPSWGFIGKIDRSWEDLKDASLRYYLFTHIEFNVLYNQNQIIEVISFSDPNYSADITEDVEIEVEFVYSVRWDETLRSFEGRMEKYLRDTSLPKHQQIHWFSITNSIIVLTLLLGFLTTVFMKILRNDLNKYYGNEEDDNEVGWKYIHGDVFRYPPLKSTICAILGCGNQLLMLAFLVFFLAFWGIFYPYKRGSFYTSVVIIYALTSAIAGYTAISFHTRLGGIVWVPTMLLTGSLFSAPLFLIFFIVNAIAASYGATATLPFGTIGAIFLIWIIISIPMLIAGSLVGLVTNSEFQPPSAPRRHPMDIPKLPWYRRTTSQMFLAGVLPFSAIFTELYYVFASLWGHKIYAVCGIWFIVFIILILLTAILSVGLTFLQLSGEDYRWWWRSLICGGSTSIFIYGYCCYFYAKSEMTGLMQLSFFFCYNACICYAMFLMLGTVAFRASFLFVCRIYSAIKSE
ncbi:transmembrane 9 superfamily member 2-like [Aristolochia californica]|uniref:transmembrane 9 superfamily member 2-like n=1 Tax=Aristolochia californica TaxID=171875 RepID=UPI0035DDE4ED